MSQQRPRAFVVACEDCEVERATDDANETTAFYRRHSAATGHDLVWKRVDLDLAAGALDTLDEREDADPKAVVAALDDHYADGVPIGVVAAAMGERGATVGEAFDAIHALRMRGALYEPRDDHLRPF